MLRNWQSSGLTLSRLNVIDWTWFGRLRLIHVALLAAVAGTVIFFLPLVASYSVGGSRWPSFMITGDIKMAWFPQYVQGYHRFWSGSIFGADFLTHGGASTFAFRANMLPFYPPYLVSYLLFDISNVRTAGIVFLVIHMLHVFFGIFFAVLLARRYIRLSRGASVLFAGLYCLSYQASNYIALTPKFYQMMLLPAVVFLLCRLLVARTFASVVVTSMLIATYTLTSYGPTMIAGFGIAIIVFLYVLVTRFSNATFRIARLRAPLMAIGLAFLVAIPYYLCQINYLPLVPGTPHDLVNTAHVGNFLPSDLLHGLSQYMLNAPGVEGRLYWGLIPVVLLLVGLALAIAAPGLAAQRTLSVYKITLPVYIGMMLIAFGTYTIASDMFFYGVPFLGKMHLYQRFLVFGQFLFALAVAASAGFAVAHATRPQRLAIFATGLIMWAVGSFWLISSSQAPQIVIVEHVLPELFLAFVALVAISIGRTSVTTALLTVPIALYALVPLYGYQRALGQSTVWQTSMEYSKATQQRIGDMFAVKGKVLPKVYNVTDQIDSYLQYNLSWLLPGGVRFMNYYGYEPHLAVEVSYWNMMGGFYGRFNRDWLLASGVDVLVWDDATRFKVDAIIKGAATLGPVNDIGGGLKAAKVLHNDVVDPNVSELLLDYTENKPEMWKVAPMDGWALRSGRMVKVAGGKNNHFGITLGSRVGRRYEVSFDVIGSSKGTVNVSYGGTGGPPIPGSAPGRQTFTILVSGPGDLWFSGTPDFDGSITNIMVRSIPEPVSADAPKYPRVFDNGILKLEGAPANTAVSGFETNWSTRVSADMSSAEPSRLTYLLWPNFYMKPYLDGRKVDWQRSDDRPAYLDLPAGKHRFELRFESGRATFARIAWTIYGIIVIGVLFAPLFVRLRPMLTAHWHRRSGRA